jgi:predicted lipid-binding transport protein (Tim44 family)
VPQKRSWLGPIAGLAAGLGIAALMSHMGFGEGMGNVVMLALLAGAAVFLVMFLIRRFAPGAGSASPAFAGAGTGAGGPRAGPSWAPLQPMADPSVVPGRLPQPLAPQTGLTGDPAPASAAVAAPALSRAFVPASFDSQGFARTAKTIFIRMQAANDAADLDDLRRFTTPELFAALKLDLLERGSAKQTTDVVEVNADVLDVASETDRDIVSVRFHGRVVEEQGAAPQSFDEIWHLIRPLASNDAWLIAGIEQSQSR